MFTGIYLGGDGVDNVKRHLQRMDALRRGEKIDCPFCGKGKISKKSEIAFTCDVCGKGIVGHKQMTY